ncbi:unnamed protein product [Rhizoctonia solani]|uniref:Uncharacterized protein n=1 Tax=Rhizoctonia solani TaxID=456999 RepID=A0A8H3H1B2_9AGAM|nr:unnamed protein product [Rhizoctonia solani]
MTKTPEAVFYPTYHPPYSPPYQGGISTDVDVKQRDTRISTDGESQQPSMPDITEAHGPWWMPSFKNLISLVLFLICGGAAIGFCLANAHKMSFRLLIAHTTPGGSKPHFKDR